MLVPSQLPINIAQPVGVAGPINKLDLKNKEDRNRLIKNLIDFKNNHKYQIRNDSLEILIANLKGIVNPELKDSVNELIKKKIKNYGSNLENVTKLLSLLNFYNSYFPKRYVNFPQLENICYIAQQKHLVLDYIEPKSLSSEHLTSLDLQLDDNLKIIHKEYADLPSLSNLGDLARQLSLAAENENQCLFRKRVYESLAGVVKEKLEIAEEWFNHFDDEPMPLLENIQRPVPLALSVAALTGMCLVFSWNALNKQAFDSGFCATNVALEHDNGLDTLESADSAHKYEIAQILENSTGERFFTNYCKAINGMQETVIVPTSKLYVADEKQTFKLKLKMNYARANTIYYLPLPHNSQIMDFSLTPDCEYQLNGNQLIFPKNINQPLEIIYSGAKIKTQALDKHVTKLNKIPSSFEIVEFLDPTQKQLRINFAKKANPDLLKAYMSNFYYVTSNDIAEIIKKMPKHLRMHLKIGDCNMFTEHLNWLLQDIRPCASAYGYVLDEDSKALEFNKAHAKFRYLNDKGITEDFETTAYVKLIRKKVKLTADEKARLKGLVAEINKTKLLEEQIGLVRNLEEELRVVIEAAPENN